MADVRGLMLKEYVVLQLIASFLFYEGSAGRDSCAVSAICLLDF